MVIMSIKMNGSATADTVDQRKVASKEVWSWRFQHFLQFLRFLSSKHWRSFRSMLNETGLFLGLTVATGEFGVLACVVLMVHDTIYCCRVSETRPSSRVWLVLACVVWRKRQYSSE